jgi:hypothetical protein
MIVVEFNGFKHFLGKGGERSYSWRENAIKLGITFDFFVLVYLEYILLSYNTDQAFMKAHFRPRTFLGLFIYTTVLCSLLFSRTIDGGHITTFTYLKAIEEGSEQ